MLTGYNESALLRLQRVVAYYQLYYADTIEGFDVNPVQFEIVMFLAHNTPCSVTDVAGFLLVELSTASRIIKGMVTRGLVTLAPDPEDGRRKRVSLTDKGFDLYHQARPAWDIADDKILSVYDDVIAELEQL